MCQANSLLWFGGLVQRSAQRYIAQWWEENRFPVLPACHRSVPSSFGTSCTREQNAGTGPHWPPHCTSVPEWTWAKTHTFQRGNSPCCVFPDSLYIPWAYSSVRCSAYSILRLLMGAAKLKKLQLGVLMEGTGLSCRLLILPAKIPQDPKCLMRRNRFMHINVKYETLILRWLSMMIP